MINSRDPALLESGFSRKLFRLMEACEKRGLEFKFYHYLRHPATQARYWRRSRTTWEIEKEIKRLKRRGAGWLAQLINDVGPQYGKWATNALPGLSWHQWGLAADCVLIRRGKAEWDGGHPGYVVLHEEAKALGLSTGLHYNDAGHVQAEDGKILDHYTWPQIDAAMRVRFEEEEE